MPSSVLRRVAIRLPIGLLPAALVLAISGCGGDEPGEPGEPAVFFVEPTDGATVTSPFQVVMGSRNVEIGAVPSEVLEARPGIVHYHLGTNTDCLPVGEIIPQADPWIHFGDGSNEIEVNLPPGDFRLALQAGDDEHRTLAGLCEVITVSVVEGEDDR